LAGFSQTGLASLIPFGGGFNKKAMRHFVPSFFISVFCSSKLGWFEVGISFADPVWGRHQQKTHQPGLVGGKSKSPDSNKFDQGSQKGLASLIPFGGGINKKAMRHFVPSFFISAFCSSKLGWFEVGISFADPVWGGINKKPTNPGWWMEKAKAPIQTSLIRAFLLFPTAVGGVFCWRRVRDSNPRRL
jgi:hypothetical protein